MSRILGSSVLVAATLALCLFNTPAALAQPEAFGWGELSGVRVDGELRQVNTRLTAFAPGWERYTETAHWRTLNPGYERDGDDIVLTGRLGVPGAARGPGGGGGGSGGGRGRPQGGIEYRQVVRDAGTGAVRLDIEATAHQDADLQGLYLFVKLPGDEYGQGAGQLVGAEAPVDRGVSFAKTRPADDRHYVGGAAAGARLTNRRHQLSIEIDGEPREVIIQDDRAGDGSIGVFFPVHAGAMTSGQTVRLSCTITVAGEVDRTPAVITIDPSQRGRTFEGVGGNFCWQTQSPTMDFYLDNVRVAWGRVLMPLHVWQPEETGDPTTRPVEQLHEDVQEALRVSKELHERGIPMIISAWNAPRWALVQGGSGRGFGRGRVDPEKLDALVSAIGSYLVMFKQVVGAEPAMFSFNESNLGINVLMSPEEHRDFIRKAGAHFQSLGLRTRLLLGDANEPRAVDFPLAALEDPEAMRYVAGVSYHSWNHGTDDQLDGWRRHAERAGVPLFVGEAGTDPDAHRYRPIMRETWYALDEAVMYHRCLSLSQPASILHWQLTPDYGFVHESEEHEQGIELTQRWYQFKQLDQLTPPDATILSATSDRDDLIVSALAGEGGGVSVVHVVNTGASRPVTVTGLPDDVTGFRVHVTDAERGMEQIEPVQVSDGSARLTLPAQSVVTLSKAE